MHSPMMKMLEFRESGVHVPLTSLFLTRMSCRYQRRGKPPYSYVALVAMCIQSSPNKRLRLREILKNIESMFPFFQVRHSGKERKKNDVKDGQCVSRHQFFGGGDGNCFSVRFSCIDRSISVCENRYTSSDIITPCAKSQRMFMALKILCRRQSRISLNICFNCTCKITPFFNRDISQP